MLETIFEFMSKIKTWVSILVCFPSLLIYYVFVVFLFYVFV